MTQPLTDDYHVNVAEALNALSAGAANLAEADHYYSEAQVRATLALAAAVHRLSS